MRRLRLTKSGLAAIWAGTRCVAALLAILAVWPVKSLCQSPNAAPPQQSLTLQEYVTELDRCAAILNTSPADPAAIHELRTTLPANWTVTAGESHYTVSTAWLSGALAGIERNPEANKDGLAQIRDKLQTYREEAQALQASTDSQYLAQSRDAAELHPER